MELVFQKNLCRCMQKLCRQEQTREETQEVRLGEHMPEIGHVLGTWGQVLVRSKEWHSGSISVSGGVMAWVLYEPEEGGTPVGVETWLPFQMKWEIPDTDAEGVIHLSCALRSADARSVSARKLMVRANVAVTAHVMAHEQVELYVPEDCPGDIQLLHRTYPVLLPSEAGEKPFGVEETFSLPNTMPGIQKILRYGLSPQITDKKVMGDKVVFRGVGYLHLMYMGDDNRVYSWDDELPFSQYAELEREYGGETEPEVDILLNALEVEPEENGGIHMKAGLAGQYVIYDHYVVEAVEDVYSTLRYVTPQETTVQLPAVLDMPTRELTAQQELTAEGTQIADVSFEPDQVDVSRDEEQICLSCSGSFQILYYDLEEKLRSESVRWSDSWQLPADSSCTLEGKMTRVGSTGCKLSAGNAHVWADMHLCAIATTGQGIPMISALDIGEEKKKDPNRPNLILRKLGGESLWQIAKESGSTVEAIQAANRLEGTPEKERFLLIPVS